MKKTHAFVICLLDDEDLLRSVRKALIRFIQQRRRTTEQADARHLIDLLTPREFQVMELAEAGMLNKQIAGELGMAEKTVKVHHGRVIQKLGVTSVAELVRLVQRVRPKTKVP